MVMVAHNGKGSRLRPVDKKKYDENFDRIFKKKEVQQDEVKQVKKD